MAESPGIKVPPTDAERVRRRLLEQGLLRDDLLVRKDDDGVVFPVRGPLPDLDVDAYDFRSRAVRARDYRELLPEQLQDVAPRAYDLLGDIAIIKLPKPLWPARAEVGQALLGFHKGLRAAFADHGVQGPFRVRGLERIAGHGGTETTVQENGLRLAVDLGRAYFSPRLADERARIASLAQAGQHVIDLFAGVAPLGVLLAKHGCDVVCIDLNPAAVELARRNAEQNSVEIDIREGDARHVAPALPPADRVVMNLPHSAKEFLDVAAAATKPGGAVHHHEILAKADLEARTASLAAEFTRLGRKAVVEHVRHVREYSAMEAHYAFDVRLP